MTVGPPSVWISPWDMQALPGKAQRRARRFPPPGVGCQGSHGAGRGSPRCAPRLGACSSPGRRPARLGPCRVSYSLLVKGTPVICGAGMGTLVTLT